MPVLPPCFLNVQPSRQYKLAPLTQTHGSLAAIAVRQGRHKSEQGRASSWHFGMHEMRNFDLHRSLGCGPRVNQLNGRALHFTNLWNSSWHPATSVQRKTEWILKTQTQPPIRTQLRWGRLGFIFHTYPNMLNLWDPIFDWNERSHLSPHSLCPAKSYLWDWILPLGVPWTRITICPWYILSAFVDAMLNEQV